jgi:hypothetical protein
MNNKTSITSEMLETLPPPIQRYLRWTGVIGKPWIDKVTLEQTGRFRMSPDRPWMPMHAKQIYTTSPPSFEWNARFRLFGLPVLRARDYYQNGHGHMWGKLAGLVTIFDVSGEKLDQGALTRYLSEVIWFPTAFLGPNMAWEAVDDHSAKVTLTDASHSVSGVLHVDDQGKPTNFTCQRYYLQGDDFTLEHWSTPIYGYRMMSGLNLPVQGGAQWHLESGQFTYIDINIAKIEYS